MSPQERKIDWCTPNQLKMKHISVVGSEVKSKWLSRVRLSETPWMIQSVEFSRPE